MLVSIFDLFAIGIGPSSSHTVGPMKAARAFVLNLSARLSNVGQVTIELFGSLAFTGKGHGTDKAILMGLEGWAPDQIDPDNIDERVREISENKQILLAGSQPIEFNVNTDLIFNFKDLLPAHTNGMRFTASDDNGNLLQQQVFYSVGGGFILSEAEIQHPPTQAASIPYPFASAKSLLHLCESNKLSMAEIMLANESSLRHPAEVKERLATISAIMLACIEKRLRQQRHLARRLKY